jgi:hypothetical protein
MTQSSIFEMGQAMGNMRAISKRKGQMNQQAISIFLGPVKNAWL